MIDIDSPQIDEDGTQRWFKDDELHRDGDKPALIYEDGKQCWYQDGKQHRDGDLPAMIAPNGSKSWYKDDQLASRRGFTRGYSCLGVGADGAVV